MFNPGHPDRRMVLIVIGLTLVLGGAALSGIGRDTAVAYAARVVFVGEYGPVAVNRGDGMTFEIPGTCLVSRFRALRSPLLPGRMEHLVPPQIVTGRRRFDVAGPWQPAAVGDPRSGRAMGYTEGQWGAKDRVVQPVQRLRTALWEHIALEPGARSAWPVVPAPGREGPRCAVAIWI